MPLKEMVFTYIPSKNFFAPLCYRPKLFYLQTIPSPLCDTWDRTKKLPSYPCVEIVSSSLWLLATTPCVALCPLSRTSVRSDAATARGPVGVGGQGQAGADAAAEGLRAAGEREHPARGDRGDLKWRSKTKWRWLALEWRTQTRSGSGGWRRTWPTPWRARSATSAGASSGLRTATSILSMDYGWSWINSITSWIIFHVASFAAFDSPPLYMLLDLGLWLGRWSKRNELVVVSNCSWLISWIDRRWSMYGRTCLAVVIVRFFVSRQFF